MPRGLLVALAVAVSACSAPSKDAPSEPPPKPAASEQPANSPTASDDPKDADTVEIPEIPASLLEAAGDPPKPNVESDPHPPCENASDDPPKPKVRFDHQDIEGPMDAKLVKKVIREQMGRIRWCYREGLVCDPELTGSLTLQFVISPSGNVSSSAVKETDLSDEWVSKCIAKAARRWRFPQPKSAGNVTVSFAMTLEPG